MQIKAYPNESKKLMSFSFQPVMVILPDEGLIEVIPPPSKIKKL